jgi:hypothetical protein
MHSISHHAVLFLSCSVNWVIVMWQVYHLDPITLKPVGARNHIGFSGVFLTDDHKAVTRRKKARRASTRHSGSARELEQLMQLDDEGSCHASPSWAQHREHAPSSSASSSSFSSSAHSWQQSHHSSNDAARSNVKKAAAGAPATPQHQHKYAAESSGPCTADLDAALKELHFYEYDLNGVVRLRWI